MFYIDLSLQFLIKLIGQLIAPAIAIALLLMLVTAITKDKAWVKKLFNRLIEL